MSETRVLRRLSAAAEQILHVVERKMLQTPVSPGQQSAVGQKQLSVAADEIFRILQTLMDCCSLSSSRDQNTSAPPQFKDAATQTDPELIHGEASHLHQTQTTEKSNVTRVETQGQQCGAPSADQVVSLRNPEDTDEQSHGADCCKLCGRSFCNDAAENKITSKSQTTGQSFCRICGKLFLYKRSFLKHVLKHERSTDLCGVCGKHVDSVDSLKMHLQAHNEENSSRDKTDDRWSSSECSDPESKVSDSHEDWKESEGTDSNRESDEDESSGGSCSQKTKTKIQASNTRKRAKEKDLSHLKYCCKVCGKSFCYRASFLKHVQEEERTTDVCGVCDRRFETAENLRLHLQTHIRSNDCEVCGKHFDGLKQLEMHMRTHTGEKPYVCSVCGKAFAQNGNLMGHMRAHTGEKPYVCSVCGQSFGFKEYMVAHMRIHTGEKPFLCSVCGKGFRQRGTLKTHMRIHTGESTHRCGICGKKFYKSGALKIHMRAHTGEKPYLCNVCGKRFTAGSSLSKHMGVHEGQRTHRCSVCGEGFLRKEDLRKHVQTHRNDSQPPNL